MEQDMETISEPRVWGFRPAIARVGGWRFGGGNAATVKDVHGYYICVYAVLSGTYTVSFRAKARAARVHGLGKPPS